MKYIKNRLQAFILILAVLGTQNLIGQRGRHHPPNRMKIVETMKADLNLSAEQTAQIEKLKADFKEQVKAIKEDESKERSEKRAAMKILMDSQKAAVGEILTVEQKTLLEEKKAAHKDERKAKMEARKAEREVLKAALKTYRTQNIEPVLLAQRTKLEAILSDEDKAEIAELRVAFAAKKAEMEKRKVAWRANGEKRNEVDRKAKMEARKAYKEARENDKSLKALKILVEKYEHQIEELYVEIKPQQIAWKAEQKKIIQQYKPERNIEDKKHHTTEGYRRSRGEKAHHRKGEGRRGHHLGIEGKMKKGHFLLLDPNQLIQDSQATALTQIKIYPNPATSRNTLDYEVKEAGRIKIEIHDEQGRLVKVLLDEEKAAGQYQLNTDLSALKNRTYFYVVSDKQGRTTKKFLIL